MAELLRSYRIAHARVQSIESFETSLKENTPLTSINDPNALIEYLNQINLKGDLVVDELKRVTSERDGYKRKLSDAERATKDAWDEVANLRAEKKTDQKEGPTTSADSDDAKDGEEIVDADPLGITTRSPTSSIKSPTTSLRSMSVFSPRSKPSAPPKTEAVSEDLFSYDNENSRLESELKEQSERVLTLKGDLAVARESTQSMVQSLEEATRELHGLRDQKDRSESELTGVRTSLERNLSELREQLRKAEEKATALTAQQESSDSSKITELESELTEVRAELEETQRNLRSATQYHQQLEELRKAADTTSAKALEMKKRNVELSVELARSAEQKKILQQELDAKTAHADSDVRAQGESADGILAPKTDTTNTSSKIDPAKSQDVAASSKKKNKKKKKTGKGGEAEKETEVVPDDRQVEATAEIPASGDVGSIEWLKLELSRLQTLVEEQNAAINGLSAKLKDQEGLCEEIESLRDDLINVGQEHVETKDRVKDLIAEKKALQAKIEQQEKQMTELESRLLADASAGEKHKEVAKHFEELKTKAATLQRDLTAAQQLASSRYKDLNDLRTSLQKAQPEINSLRSEAAELCTVKDSLSKKEAEFKRLDSRHEDMRSELARLKQTLLSRESENKALDTKFNQESTGRLKAEERVHEVTQELQRSQTDKKQASESVDRLSKDLTKARDDIQSGKTRFRELEQQLSKHRSETEGLKEDVELKTAQYQSAQSLMASMRDQTSEMATQLKEARERCESLDEEVADAHRLLSERSREGETMRRLLADVESRADSRVREMKERMDSAIEERDRVEEEASTAGRRRARELEELRNKFRDVERTLKRTEEDKDELEAAQRNWKRRREDLERRSEQAKTEADEVRKAMGDIRDALDESERQNRDSEKLKVELRRSTEEMQHRLEKLQNQNKVRRFPHIPWPTNRSPQCPKRTDKFTVSDRRSHQNPNHAQQLHRPLQPQSRRRISNLIQLIQRPRH